MATSLAVQTSQAMRAVEVGLSSRSLELVARARAAGNDQTGERDRLLREVVCRYRSGPRNVWAAVLLDLLTPALLARLARYRTEPPAIDAEDIRQQFVLELLGAATTMPLPNSARFVERRLLMRAGQGVRRSLRKERFRLALSKSLEGMEAREEESR